MSEVEFNEWIGPAISLICVTQKDGTRSLHQYKHVWTKIHQNSHHKLAIYNFDRNRAAEFIIIHSFSESTL